MIRSRGIPSPCLTSIKRPAIISRFIIPSKRLKAWRLAMTRGRTSAAGYVSDATVGAVCDRALEFGRFLPRRRRERTIAGGTRASFSAYHRNNEAPEKRTLNRVRGFLAPRWGPAGVRTSIGIHHPGVTLAALANPRLISRHASGVRRMAELQGAVGDRAL